MDKRKDDAALSEAELETLFLAADAEAPLPSAELFERILADAAEVQADATSAAAKPAPRGWFTGLKDTLGGWGGLSGLAGAVATGLVIGVFPPETLIGYADTLLGTDAYFTDYVPGLGEVSFDG